MYAWINATNGGMHVLSHIVSSPLLAIAVPASWIDDNYSKLVNLVMRLDLTPINLMNFCFIFVEPEEDNMAVSLHY